ncbi:MAG: DUF3955 domain-containing protein [Clostridium sp.]|uniref:DUF3955 domain-containing protein n=1 Tax=Clostridium sp. LY3-2 TaxID=2942482 RepID=UPI0021536EA7|nr:DUF3955 domain-containing protein [Clostridium sp. LY3-2]MCR6515964.1 DUF3955 domain-containing protein [Clostridium sp. LY3-2]
MKKLIYLSPYILGLLCFLVNITSDTYVNSEGFLVEPYFFMIPLGYLFIFIGIIITLFKAPTFLRKRFKKSANIN